MIRTPPHPHKRLFLVVVSLVLPPLIGRPGPPFFAPSAVPAIERAAGGAAGSRGVIQICSSPATPPQPYARAVDFDAQRGALVGSLSGNEQVVLELTLAEARELAHAAVVSEDGCIDVSMGASPDQKNGYVSQELRDAPTVAEKLLVLDGALGVLLEGGYPVDEAVLAGAPLPPVAARRLLDPESGDFAYQRLARTYPRPPRSGHSFTFRADFQPGAGAHVSLEVNPTLLVETADGRRLQLAPQDVAVASRPYAALVRRLEADPAAFTDVVPSLKTGMRYASAFALLTACRQAETLCVSPLLDQARATAAAEEDTDAAGHRTSTALMQAFAVLAEEARQRNALRQVELKESIKRIRLENVWREYRMSFNVYELESDVRIGMFVDEAIQWFTGLEAERSLQLMGKPAPGKVLALVDALDASTSPYAGWVDLGRFAVGAWAGRPLPEVIAALARADAQAARDDDAALRFQIYHAAENLLPLLQSAVALQMQSGQPNPMLYQVFDPWAIFGSTPVEATRYLDALSERLPQLIAIQALEDYNHLNWDTNQLFGSDGSVIAPSHTILEVKARVAALHLLDERKRIHAPDNPLLLEARLCYAAGLAFAHAHEIDNALDQARLLDSLWESHFDELDGRTVAQLGKWANEIRTQARL